MTHEEQMELVRELGELYKLQTLADKSEENIKRGERIKEIRRQLDLKSNAKANRRPCRYIPK